MSTKSEVTGGDIVAMAMKLQGKPYVFGGKAAATTEPDQIKGIDCSGLVSWAVRRFGLWIPDGARYQYAKCNPVPIGVALRTPGMLLFWKRPVLGVVHVAISRGDGTTIEARGKKYGVGMWSAIKGRGFNFAGSIPGVKYGR